MLGALHSKANLGGGSRGSILALARRWPAWLHLTLMAMGRCTTVSPRMAPSTARRGTWTRLRRSQLASPVTCRASFPCRLDASSRNPGDEGRRNGSRRPLRKRCATRLEQAASATAGQSVGQANLTAAIAANAAAAQQHAANAAAANAAGQAATLRPAGTSGQTTLTQMGPLVKLQQEDQNRWRARVGAAENSCTTRPT